MVEKHLRLPFETDIPGMTVIVEGVDIRDNDQLVVVCRKNKVRQRISLSGLPLPSPVAALHSQTDDRRTAIAREAAQDHSVI